MGVSTGRPVKNSDGLLEKDGFRLAYKHYYSVTKREFPELKHISSIFFGIVKSFHRKIAMKMITDQYIHRMGGGLGEIYIGQDISYKRKRLELFTDENGHKIKQLDVNTSRKITKKLAWDKTHLTVKNHSFYRLLPEDEIKKLMGRHIQEHNDNPINFNRPYRTHIVWRKPKINYFENKSTEN